MFTRRRMMKATAGTALAAGLAGCQKSDAPVRPASVANAILDVFDDRMLDFLPADSEFETLGVGYQWSEGPAWDPVRNCLYFSDVPGNIVYKWTADKGVSEFLNPSTAGSTLDGFREQGVNGLLVSPDGNLLLCDHGARSVQRMDLSTGDRTVLSDSYQNAPFNSPNDLILGRDGSIYFTDPPYGLDGLDDSPLKEQPHNGVYRRYPDGTVQLIVSDMTRPNGVALSPDQKTLYIAQSDPAQQIIRSVALSDDPGVLPSQTFVDLEPYATEGMGGLPDGMAVTRSGHIFATGPGGVFVIAPQGDVLGRILTGRPTANCAFGEAGSTLFITSQDRLLKLPVTAQGL